MNEADITAAKAMLRATWPDGKRLAVHVAINLEHFVFGEGGVDFDRPTPPPNQPQLS